VLQPNISRLPLRCGDCFRVVPFYRLPHADGRKSYEDILHWQRLHEWLDGLWTDSGVGERFAYRELSRHDSDLSKEGRQVCRRIERQSQVPTYYSLHYYSLRSRPASRTRPCPGCGRKWLLGERWHWYSLRCNRCRLVSDIE
jgi:predicted  nucleic acid-binding Zn ribbon protein